MDENKTLLDDKINSVKKKISFKQIFDIIIIIVMLIFALQNLESIRVSLLFFSFEMPLFVLIIAVFAIGYFTNKLFKKS
ncbi:MAG: LapA family protein [Ignavibacteria bacterium]|nr:LapA family protein [Ignavibacteria bacterium]